MGRLPELLDRMEAELAPLEALLDPPDRPDAPGAGGAEGAPTAGGSARKADLDAAWAEVRDALIPALERGVESFDAEAARLGPGRIAAGG